MVRKTENYRFEDSVDDLRRSEIEDFGAGFADGPTATLASGHGRAEAFEVLKEGWMVETEFFLDTGAADEAGYRADEGEEGGGEECDLDL